MLWLRKITFLLLLTGLMTPAFARDHEQDRQAYRQVLPHRHNMQQNMSLDDAVSRVRQQTQGRVLSAEERDSEFKIRIITKGGKVRRLRVDPETGEIVR
jgi:uncharacterized membrane protein YkoI